MKMREMMQQLIELSFKSGGRFEAQGDGRCDLRVAFDYEDTRGAIYEAATVRFRRQVNSDERPLRAFIETTVSFPMATTDMDVLSANGFALACQSATVLAIKGQTLIGRRSWDIEEFTERDDETS